MDSKHNQNILVDDSLVFFDGIVTIPTASSRIYFSNDHSKNTFIPNVFLKVDISAIKKSDGDEGYYIELWIDDESGSDISFLSQIIPVTILDSNKLGYTYYLPVNINWIAAYLEVVPTGTNPNITIACSLVKEFKNK